MAGYTHSSCEPNEIHMLLCVSYSVILHSHRRRAPPKRSIKMCEKLNACIGYIVAFVRKQTAEQTNWYVLLKRRKYTYEMGSLFHRVHTVIMYWLLLFHLAVIGLFQHCLWHISTAFDGTVNSLHKMIASGSTYSFAHTRRTQTHTLRPYTAHTHTVPIEHLRLIYVYIGLSVAHLPRTACTMFILLRFVFMGARMRWQYQQVRAFITLS